MLKNFYPYSYIDSVFSIDYHKLYAKGYRGLLLDIDNTLVHHGADSTKEIDALFQQLHAIGFQTLLISDNGEDRVKRFVRNITTSYICNADKPDPASFHLALAQLGLPKDQVIYIGDQIFKDIYGANQCGIPSILVKYLRYDTEKWIGFRRILEKHILLLYRLNRKYSNRLGDILLDSKKAPAKTRKLFCDLNPTCYAISQKKEILKRHLKNLLSKETFAQTIQKETLPCLLYRHSSNMIKRAPGVDLTLQQNKAVNIRLACKKVDHIIVRPGEVFSVWKLVGNTTKRKGYKEGRIIRFNRLMPGIGGGLCNFGNTIHLLVLHSPLSVTEFHTHSDALAPDEGKRVPLSAGTSISYNTLDFRFKNNTDQVFQICLWCEGDIFYAELRSDRELPYSYEIVEEDHCFVQEKGKYYRCSQIYRNTIEKETGAVVKKERILDNHSEVMYDYSLIPPSQIRR